MCKVLATKKIRSALIELVERIDSETNEPFWRVIIEIPGRRTSAPYRDIKEAKNAYNENVRTLSIFGTMND